MFIANRGPKRGSDGYCPDWYKVHRVAKIYGMNPQTVEDEMPIFWVEAALIAEQAEHEGEEEFQKRHRVAEEARARNQAAMRRG